MTEPASGGRAVFRAGVVEYPSREDYEREVETLVSSSVLWVTGAALPPPLEEFQFSFAIPDGPRIPMAGRIILQKEELSLIEVRLGRDAYLSALADLRMPDRRKERRMLPRTERKMDLRLGKEDCFTYDISPAGLCIACANALPVGSVLEGSLALNGQRLLFAAEVRWSIQDGEGPTPARLGVRLLSIGHAYYDLFRETKPVPQANAPVQSVPRPLVATPRPPSAAPVAMGTPRPPMASTPVPLKQTPSPLTQTPPPPSQPAAWSTGAPLEVRKHRRLLPRTRRRFKVKIGASTGFTFDVSPRGMGIELLKTIAPGTQIDGKLFIGDKELSFTAQVRWARAGLPAVGVRARVGLLISAVPNDYFELFQHPDDV